jgi:hypothetical protein
VRTANSGLLQTLGPREVVVFIIRLVALPLSALLMHFRARCHVAAW